MQEFRNRGVLAAVVFSLAAVAVCLAQAPADIEIPAATPFQFVAYGDMRVTNPEGTYISRAPVRRALVQGIADANPTFVSIGGDLVAKGASRDDWEIYDRETAVWRERQVRVFPALGNHDLHGDRGRALANYYKRFPELRESRYYSVRAANTLMLVLDSSLDEVSGPQGQWLRGKLTNLPATVEFVLIVLHHPLITGSSGKRFWAGHSVRPAEKALARMLEQMQKTSRARFVVFAGHIHNYERYQREGVTYFVTGGGGSHPYTVRRRAEDPLADSKVNYHFLLCRVEQGSMTVTMHRLELTGGRATWTQPDQVRIDVPPLSSAADKNARQQ